jgi:hypothetical protein
MRPRGAAGRSLHFRAHPNREDAFTPFRTQTKNVGPRLLEIIDRLPLGTKPLKGARLLVRRA